MGRKRSVVWKFFKDVPGCRTRSGKQVVCVLCNKVLLLNGSTSRMLNHLRMKHPKALEDVSDEPVLISERVGNSPSRRTRRRRTSRESLEYADVNEVEITEDDEELEIEETNDEDENTIISKYKTLARYLASTLQPIYRIQDVSFKRMLLDLDIEFNEFTNGGRATSVDGSVCNPLFMALGSLYDEVTEMFQRKLMQHKRFAISLEIWMKNNHELYLLITANYVTEEWKLESILLGVRLLPGINLVTEENIVEQKVSQVLNNILDEYSLSLENVLHVVINFGPFNFMGSHNILSLKTWPCWNHALRRSYERINTAFSTVGEPSYDLLKSALSLGKIVLCNYKNLKMHPGKLIKCLKHHLFNHQEVVDKFNMLKIEDLEEFIEVQEPISKFVDAGMDHPVLPGSSLLPSIVQLRLLYNDQFLDNHAHASSAPSISSTRKKEIGNDICTQLENSYKVDLSSDNFGGDLSLAVCGILDPRYKQLEFLTFSQRNKTYEVVYKLLRNLEKESAPIQNNCPASASSVVGNPSPNPFVSWNFEKLAALIGPAVNKQPIELPSDDVLREFQDYLNVPCAPLCMNPYLWWSCNHSKFPHVGDLAKQYFCLRGTSTSSTMMFTKAGKQFWKELSGIEREFVEKLLVLGSYHYQHPVLRMTEENAMPIDLKAEEGSSCSADVLFHVKNELMEEDI